MILITDTDKTCCKKILDRQYAWVVGYTEQWVCGKPAVYKQGTNYFCRHHAKMGRYVLRQGDSGNILARYDTEEQVREAYKTITDTDVQMQRLTGSKRRRIL